MGAHNGKINLNLIKNETVHDYKVVLVRLCSVWLEWLELFLGGSVPLHVLVVAGVLVQLLHVEEVPLGGQQRNIRVGQYLPSELLQRQAVLLDAQHLEARTGGQVVGDLPQLILVQINLAGLDVGHAGRHRGDVIFGEVNKVELAEVGQLAHGKGVQAVAGQINRPQ